MGRGESKEERRNIVDSSFDYCHEDQQEIISEDEHKLTSMKAEMDEAREENRRLKLYLSKVMKDYEALQTQYNQMVEQQLKRSPQGHEQEEEAEDGEINKEREELVSLSLGRRKSPFSRGSTTKEEKKKAPLMAVDENAEEEGEGLSIGLDYQVVNPNENEETDDQKETLKISNNNQSPESSFGLRNYGDDHDEELLQQNLVKKARVSVRARCDTPTMNDGCQWRKYGQKTAKGNPCPRAYYRCTVGPSCPVRKQVQRCSEDMTILVTTYEGTHNHPLSISATAMASATAAAASMLLSGTTASSGTTAANLHGLNFYLSNNSLKPKSPYLTTSNSSSSSSSSSCHPTIILDLTTSSLSNQSSSPSLSQPFFSLFNRFLSTPSGITNSFPQASRSHPSTNLNFSSNNMNSPLGSTNTLYWGCHGGVHTTYDNTFSGTHQIPYHLIQNQTVLGALDPFRRSLSQPTQSNINIASIKNMNFSSSKPTSLSQGSLHPETIQAITTDPDFQSALANVISSIIDSDRNTDVTKR